MPAKSPKINCNFPKYAFKIALIASFLKMCLQNTMNRIIFDFCACQLCCLVGKRPPYICGYNIFKVMNTYFIIKIWHICFFKISCQKQSSAFSSHGKGLFDLKNIGNIWLHWNMAAFGHESWFYDAVPFHPSLFEFLERKKWILIDYLTPFGHFRIIKTIYHLLTRVRTSANMLQT